MKLSERETLTRRIRSGDLEAIEEFILYIHKKVLDIPLEHYETKYYGIHESMRWHLDFEDTKYVYLFNLTLLLLNDNIFMRRFERLEDESVVDEQVKDKLKYCNKYLNYEFTTQDDKYIIEEISRINNKLIKRYENKKINYNDNLKLLEYLRISSENLPDHQREIFQMFLGGTSPELISKITNISIKKYYYTMKNILISLEDDFFLKEDKNNG